MSALPRSIRRPADVLHAPSNDVLRSQSPDFVESASEQRSTSVRTGNAREDGRPNNWRDCYTWSDSSTGRAAKKTVKLEGYDKWARHHDPKNPKQKSKTNNIADLSLIPPMLDLQSKLPALVKQHLPRSKAGGSGSAPARTVDDFGRRCDPAELLRAVCPVSNSAVQDDPTQASSYIWTALSDLLPQSKASLDQMSSRELVTEVMNIRDKLQSASSFGVILSKQSESEMTSLQRDYLDSIIEILQRQESCYMIALKRVIVADEDSNSLQNTAELVSPKSDSKSEERTELDISGSSSDELENPVEFAARIPEIPLNNQRPRIEDHIGHYSDSDLDELQLKLKRLNERALIDHAVSPRDPVFPSNLSPLIDGDSARGRKFQYGSAFATAQDVCGQKSENRIQKQMSKDPTFGKTKNPSSVPRNKDPYRHHVCEYSSNLSDNVDNFMLDCTVEDQADTAALEDVDAGVIEDLAQLMMKRHELETFLAERSRQLKELQDHHDLLKELVEQKEKEQQAAAILQTGSLQPYGGNNGQPVTPDCLPNRKKQGSNEQISGEKINKGAELRAQVSSKHGNSSQQKSLHKRAKEEDKDAIKSDKGNVRSSVKQSHDGRSQRFKVCSNPWVESAAGVAPESSEMLTDRAHTKLSDDVEELGSDCDIAGKLPSDTECKYLEKSNKQFETDEVTASDTDEDDGQNLSLALRDEVQYSSSNNKTDYLSEFDCDDNSVSDPERLTEHLQNETAIMKLQFNMSKLVEAKKELEDLRNLLHGQAHQSSVPKVTKSPHPSGLGDNRNGQRHVQEMKNSGAAVTFDVQDSDQNALQKLRLLKAANEKLDRLKLVMDDVQKFPGLSPPSNSGLSPSSLGDRISTTKASNTSRASNASRLTQISELTAATTADAAETNRSEQSTDGMAEHPHCSNLGNYLKHLVTDEKSSLSKNGKSVANTGKNNCQSTIKDTVFIRNSLPESVSSVVTSHLPSGSRGGAEGLSSGPAKDKDKLASKNSSITDMSKVSCFPCVSRSADRLPLDSNSLPMDKNLQRPCKVIKNQHLKSSRIGEHSLSSMFRRYRCGNNVDPCPQKGVNVGRKSTIVNTEKMQPSEMDDSGQIRTDLANINKELRLLRREVSSLTQCVNKQTLSSGRKADDCHSNVLDPQLLVGLNQSFQQLLADNQRLSERFCQLRDFVVKHSSGSHFQSQQHTCGKPADNLFTVRDQGGELGSDCDRFATYRVAKDEAACSSDETWAKQVINPMNARSAQHGTVKSQCPARILAYMETDVAAQSAASPRMYLCTGACNGAKECVDCNHNRNNSKVVSVGSNSVATVRNKDSGRAKVNGCFERSLIPEKISVNDSNIEHYKFDALSELIYSEVAVFISKHESRPHYLLELIRLLQKLKTNALRYQTVNAFDRIIADFLTDDQLSVSEPPSMEPSKTLLAPAVDDALQDGYPTYRRHDTVELSRRILGTESCTSQDKGEDDLLDEDEDEDETEDKTECGSVSCCTDHDEDADWRVGECARELSTADDFSEGGETDDKLDKKWRSMEGNIDAVESEADETLYPPDFKSTSSSNQEDDEYNVVGLSSTPKPNMCAMPCHDLNAVAERMGFVTVEFSSSASPAVRENSETEKSSSVSDGEESWEETEIPERRVGSRNGSESSSEIIEEIIVEDDSCGSVEETRLDQLHQNLTSISKEEIAKQMAVENQGQLSAQLILETVEQNTSAELTGDDDALAVKPPVSSSFDEDMSRKI